MLTARRVRDSLRQLGVTHVVGLPDNSTAALFRVLTDDPSIDLITVTREGEAFAIAAGLWIGGRKPVVLIQNTGLLESGDALRGTLTRMRIPMVCLISYRGFKSLPGLLRPTPTADDLARREVDSAALLLEPTLKAWALPYEFLSDNDELDKLRAADERAQRELCPLAIVLTETIR